ncbi:MAG: MCE family protein [Spirochaetes bacterium]|nr:MAG: MCE family protein [Spirochaetota bacterium]
MKLEKNELRVAIFIIVPVVLLLLAVMLKLGYSIASSTMDVYLKIDSLTSIKEGTPVKIKGYTIGRVTDIKPVFKPALHFLAVLRIQKEIQLYEDCGAFIFNQNIIGDPIIEIRNPEKKGEPLVANAVIEGIEYGNLDTVVQKVSQLLTSLNSMIGVIQDITLESKGNLRELVATLTKSAGTLNDTLMNSQKDVIAILGSFRDTAKTMNRISEELEKSPMKFLFKDKKE